MGDVALRLEPAGDAGLLRSVAVRDSARGAGVGTAVCDELEERARAEGTTELYLLTTSAADFFADRGYEKIERVDAPRAIRETTQFDDRCPAAAVCMRTRL